MNRDGRPIRRKLCSIMVNLGISIFSELTIIINFYYKNIILFHSIISEKLIF